MDDQELQEHINNLRSGCHKVHGEWFIAFDTNNHKDAKHYAEVLRGMYSHLQELLNEQKSRGVKCNG